MKRFFYWTAVVLVAVVVQSCSDDDEQVEIPVAEEVLADYTVMLYGVGGGDLDVFLDYNLEQVKAYGYAENVNFTAKVKYSSGEQHKEGKKGTRLMELTPEGMRNEQVAGSDFRMDDPQNLADFILSSRERFPAGKYVLVLWNHGLEFGLSDQPVKDSYATAKRYGRALLFDDNVEEDGREAVLSIFELEEALERTGEKLDLLYWDVCNMNMIEHVYQLREEVDYILGAEHVTPAMGGNYAALMHSLAENPELLPAMREYVGQTMRTWRNILGAGEPCDLTLVDVKYAEEAVQCVKQCADALIGIRDGNEPGSQEDLFFHYRLGTSDKDAGWFYSPGGYLYFPYNIGEYPATVVDMFYLFREMGEELYHGALSAYATKLSFVLDKLLPVTECIGTPDWVDRISLGIYFEEGKYFSEEWEEYEVNSMSKLYRMLDFEKVVGWSRFIEKNESRNIRVVRDENGNTVWYDDLFPYLEEITEE